MPEEITPVSFTEGGLFTDAEIRAYIDQWADTIMVRVKLGCEWRTLSVKELRALDPGEGDRVTTRLVDRGVFPHRVLIL